MVSANVRAWRTMLELRLGEGAELEIRRMAVLPPRAQARGAGALRRLRDLSRRPTGRSAGRVGVSQSREKIPKKLLCNRFAFLTLDSRAQENHQFRGSLVRHRTSFFVEGPFGSSDRTGLQSQTGGTGTSAGADSPSPVIPNHNSDVTALPSASAICATTCDQPDLYAEWDEPATIDAVERALATAGRGDPARGERRLPRAARAPPGPTSSSTSPRGSTARTARGTSPPSASSSAFPTTPPTR